jgi:hypothetical protein
LVTTSETINNWVDFKTVIESLGAYNIEYITIKEIQGPLRFKKGNSSEVLEIKENGTFLI